MKKRIFIILVLLSVASICFAQTAKYRYAFMDGTSIAIIDWKEELPDEELSDRCIPMNTKQERLKAEAEFEKFHPYFNMGAVILYIDATKNEDDPDILHIDSWFDVIAYVRGTK